MLHSGRPTRRNGKSSILMVLTIFTRKAWGFSMANLNLLKIFRKRGSHRMAPWDRSAHHPLFLRPGSIQIASARAMRQDENFRECPSCQAGKGYSGWVRKQYGWKSRICKYFVRCKGLISQWYLCFLFWGGGVKFTGIWKASFIQYAEMIWRKKSKFPVCHLIACVWKSF